MQIRKTKQGNLQCAPVPLLSWGGVGVLMDWYAHLHEGRVLICSPHIISAAEHPLLSQAAGLNNAPPKERLPLCRHLVLSRAWLAL